MTSMAEKAYAKDLQDAVVIRGSMITELANAHGEFSVKCFDPKGILKWEEEIKNVVTTVGKNYALDLYLANTGTFAGPFMGLISSTSWTGVSGSDTMSSHSGWLESGNANTPTYTAPRKTCLWSVAAAGSKALSAALSFAITGAGTVKGCFIGVGVGAVSTIDNTSGILYSAGVFSGGDKTVGNGDTLQVSYTAGL